MSSSRNPNKFSKVEKIEQARACWQMALDGYSRPVIAQTVGISMATVHRRLKSYEDKVVMPEADHWRKIQVERVQDLLAALKPQVAAGVVELAAVDRYLKALAQLDVYTGAAVPIKIEQTVTMLDSKDAELAELIAMQLAQEALAEDPVEALVDVEADV